MPKPDATAAAPKITEVSNGLFKVKSTSPKGMFRFGLGKKHAQANSLFLEINGKRRFEVGNDCDTCHFWFKCLQEPKAFAEKKIVNLPKAVSIPRPLDRKLVRELGPLIELQEKGEYYIFNTRLNLTGPYGSDDEESYFYNSEFMEIWDIEDPASEDLLSGWEHYEGKTPRVFRHANGLLEKQFDFVVPLVPAVKLKQENIRLYQQMIQSGDRPRVLLLGMLHRAVPESVSSGQSKNLHSFFASFVLDGHHKLAAYRRAGVPVNALVILSQKASKYFLVDGEESPPRARFEARLGTLAEENAA